LAKAPPNLKIERYLAVVAWVAWFVVFTVVAVLVSRNPIKHNDCGIYRGASQQWWAGKGLYVNNRNRGSDGFLYLPQFALAYTPFAALGFPVGDIAWRALGLGLFVAGLWRISGIASIERRFYIFALMTVGTLPPALASLRNGEANLHIAGFMLQTAAEIRYQRWSRAAVWLSAGIVAKPIMLVMALLSAAIYRPIIWRLALGIAVILVMPFAFGHPHYVAAQFHEYLSVMNLASNPPDLYCNIRGLFGKIGWVMSRRVFRSIAITAAGATLGLCLLAQRRWAEPVRVFLILGFAACYLMLFNPKTESNSYVILSPIIALPAAVLVGLLDRPRAAAALYCLLFLLICDAWAYRATENWLKPITGLVVLTLLVRFVLGRPRPVGISEFTETIPPAIAAAS
jgi:alpha-1,2-mannosyltransferase